MFLLTKLSTPSRILEEEEELSFDLSASTGQLAVRSGATAVRSGNWPQFQSHWLESAASEGEGSLRRSFLATSSSVSDLGVVGREKAGLVSSGVMSPSLKRTRVSFDNQERKAASR